MPLVTHRESRRIRDDARMKEPTRTGEELEEKGLIHYSTEFFFSILRMI